MNEREDWKHLNRILQDMMDNNDMIISEINNLHIALLNLKILDAHIETEIKKGTGIVPVADHLDKSIIALQENTKHIKNERYKTLEAKRKLNEYFKEDK